MTWVKSAADRQRDRAVYRNPEYVRNRALAVRRANGRCEQCGHRHRTECDHITAVSQGGSHALSNLRMLCKGPQTCRCHERKTAQEGNGYRGKAAADPQPKPGTTW